MATTMIAEVCFASETDQKLIEVTVPKGSTVIRTIMASGILDMFPELELNGNIGIFSKKVNLNEIVQEGDRVEIYRPLKQSPNQARLRRAKKIKSSN